MDQDEVRADGTGTQAVSSVPGTQRAQAWRDGAPEQGGRGVEDGPGATPQDLGMATAEYAVATLAAVGFAGLLFAVLRSGEVQELLLDLVRRALSTV